MANFVGSDPAEIPRFLGFIDEDDPTNLPLGCAALAKNNRYTLTSADTRFGYQTSMQGVNKKPISGLLGLTYTPEAADEAFFQLPSIFDFAGTLQYESPIGTGNMNPLTSALFTAPASSHMIGVQAYNRAWMAFSDLKIPASRCGVLDIKTKTLQPYGMKPFGAPFMANTQYLMQEMVTPTISNGHSYQVLGISGNGISGAEPVWPTGEGDVVISGNVTFIEYTAVLANRLPAPDAPVLARVAAGGAFPAGLDVYLMLTFLNGVGETVPSAPSVLVNTNLNDAVRVTIPSLATLPGWIGQLGAPYNLQNVIIYEADVPTGSPAPPQTQYQRVGTYPLGGTQDVTTTAVSGLVPPTLNGARITGGMLPTPVIQPNVSRVTNGGTFPAGRDVYVLQTYRSATGETLPGPASSILLTQLNDAVQINVAGLLGYPQLFGVNLYEADVPSGTPAPDSTLFQLVGTYSPGAVATITTSASGVPPPLVNTTGTQGNIVANTASGGINGTQGYRYAVIAFKNVFGTISGIVPAITKYIVDEDGWELAIFNVATGPANIAQRIVGFTVANGTPAGAFGYISADVVTGGISITSTIIADNITSKAVFNFTDEAILAAIAGGNDLTFRLQSIWPNPCVDIYYAPSVDRIFQTGVPGFYSGHWVSRAADPETYQVDTGSISIGADDGERAICVREFRGTIYSLRERSGFVISPSTTNPSSWSVNQRWTKMGPCGPRAVDVCGEFMIFVHRSGLYKYTDSFPEKISKEIPRFWNTINWKAAETICVAIDVEESEVHISLPVGGSMVPNVVLVLNYEEGWNNPLLFGRYNNKEVTVEASRKFSINDGQYFVMSRIERELPDVPLEVEGPVDTTEEQQRFRTTQFLMGSSGPDGTVQAVTPGVYDDNGAGIDWQYETTCPQKMMSIVQLRGANLNALGNGTIFPSYIAARNKVTDWAPGGVHEVKMAPFDLSPDQATGISLMCPPVSNERFRLRLHNGKAPGAWASVKYAVLYSRPIRTGRSGGR